MGHFSHWGRKAESTYFPPDDAYMAARGEPLAAYVPTILTPEELAEQEANKLKRAKAKAELEQAYQIARATIRISKRLWPKLWRPALDRGTPLDTLEEGVLESNWLQDYKHHQSHCDKIKALVARWDQKLASEWFAWLGLQYETQTIAGPIGPGPLSASIRKPTLDEELQTMAKEADLAAKKATLDRAKQDEANERYRRQKEQETLIREARERKEAEEAQVAAMEQKLAADAAELDEAIAAELRDADALHGSF